MHNKVLVATSAILALAAATASAATTIIGGVSQSSSQAVNSSQVGSNGAGGGNVFILGDSRPTLTQSSVNILSNHQQIGGGAPCTPPYCPAPTANFTLIGTASQVNNQAVNSQQVGVNGAGGGPGSTFFVGGNSVPLLFQGSTNLLFSEIILG